MTQKKKRQRAVWETCLISMSIYGLIAVSLYFLMGDQLHLRQSRANQTALPATEAVVELSQGTVVEQQFTTRVQRIEKISLFWSTYFRANSGTVTAELLNTQTGEVLHQMEFSVADLPENQAVVMAFDPPLDWTYDLPLTLRLTADSPLGVAAAPLKSTDSQPPETLGVLLVNGQPVQGVLCFSVEGTDYIWTGLHYWQFVAAGGVLLLLGLLLLLRRMKQGRAQLITHALTAVHRYRFLMEQLVKRDFRAKYKRSILGVFWSFLNPLLTMSVQYLVFSNLFRFDIPYYAVYLLTGIVVFNFFSECCGMALTSIVGNASLITKVYVPKYIYPLIRTISSGINLLISMIPLLGIALLNGLLPTKAYVLAIFPLACLLLFSMGLGMLLASSMVFFRDTQFLWGVLSMIWMYLTPIFYSEDILPDNLLPILACNPLYHFLSFFRTCIISGISPEPIAYLQCLLFAVAAFLMGAFVFKKTQDKFVLYL